MTATDFTAATRSTSLDTVLTFTGTLDSQTTPRALHEIQNLALRSGHQLIVDLTGLVFCDSRGITALLAARNAALVAHTDIVLVAVPPPLHRTLAHIGLADLFPTYPTVDSARGAVGP